MADESTVGAVPVTAPVAPEATIITGTAESSHYQQDHRALQQGHHHQLEHPHLEIGRPLSVSTRTTTSPASTPFPPLSHDRVSTPASLEDDSNFPPFPLSSTTAADKNDALSTTSGSIKPPVYVYGVAAANGPSAGQRPGLPDMAGGVSLAGAAELAEPTVPAAAVQPQPPPPQQRSTGAGTGTGTGTCTDTDADADSGAVAAAADDADARQAKTSDSDAADQACVQSTTNDAVAENACEGEGVVTTRHSLQGQKPSASLPSGADNAVLAQNQVEVVHTVTRGQHERKPHPGPVSGTTAGESAATATAPGSGLDTNLSSTSNADTTSTSATTPSHIAPLTDAIPLRTASVKHSTKIAHPKPIAVPAVPAPTAGGSTFSIANPIPPTSIVSSPFAGNVAQLEATAERLSTGTSSIGDAIRELHVELKRSDSRRSSILAASVKAATGEDPLLNPLPAVPGLKRHLSNASSIVSTNIAARHGGYSPAGFIMSPNHSLTTRLRSGSKNSIGRADLDNEPGLTRHGPGKTSVRSVRSTKMSLAEISESEPIALTKAALDEADVAPPIHYDTDLHRDTIQPIDEDAQAIASRLYDEAAAFPYEESSDAFAGPSGATADGYTPDQDEDRPKSSHSGNTFQQAQDAFVDFDGVHWTPEPEFDMPLLEEPPMMPPPARQAAAPRPQSYMDPETGQQMLYYPARVPAMLNLPPKLSSKPKAAQRNQRQSQVLGVMADSNAQSRRRSAMPDLNKRDSFLPDPLAGQRNSFSALTQSEFLLYPEQDNSVQPELEYEPSPELQPEPEVANTAHLRRPQRLTRPESDNRKSHAGRLDNIPPQLRASAYFDMPATSPDVEVKDGSAMATLDSILDASASAPVSAFTDHTYAGKLGSEVYGKEKKHKPKVSTSSLRTSSAIKEPKKRASFMWFKRTSSYNSEEKGGVQNNSTHSVHGDTHPEVDRRSSIDGESIVHRVPATRESDRDEHSEQEDENEDGFAGPPTTLLAELQLRKQQQKQRTQPLNLAYPNGMHATLLEMDAVAETQRKNRTKTRVTLAWEDPDAHLDQNGSDDEDVPLAIIAAKAQGAKNMADLERPVGLMERREMEDNEPLSHRRARLQGQDNGALAIPKRRSVATLSAHLGGQLPRAPSTQPPPSPEPEEEEEVEGETLGERKRRLAAKELPKARPVSVAFSAELLSQFGDLDDGKEKAEDANGARAKANTPGDGEETLGQRRQRLQAEREAREREMSYGNLVGQTDQQPPPLNRRVTMADVLSAQPKRVVENPAHQQRMRMEYERRLVQEQDAKMAAMRAQMPQSLNGPELQHSRGFRGGLYNDGTGGNSMANLAAQSTPALHTMGGGMPNRASVAMSAYGMPMQQQPGYAQSGQYAHMNNNVRYTVMNPGTPYGGGGLPAQMQTNVGSMDRVEQWRHGVMP